MSLFPEYKLYKGGHYSFTLNLMEKTASIGGHTDGSPVVVLPQTVEVDGVTYAVRTTGPLSFSEEPGLEELVIPDGYRSLGLGSFADCPKLRKVSLGKDFGSGEVLPFYPRLGGILGNWSVDRTALKEVTVSEDNPHIRMSADGMFILSSDGKTVLATVLDPGKELTVPEGITAIEYEALSWLDRTETISLPDGLEIIGDGAFYADRRLKRLRIPASVRFLGELFMAGCDFIEELTVLCSPKALFGIDPPDEVPFDRCKLCVPADRLNEFRAHRGWSSFKTIMPIL